MYTFTAWMPDKGATIPQRFAFFDDVMRDAEYFLENGAWGFEITDDAGTVVYRVLPAWFEFANPEGDPKRAEATRIIYGYMKLGEAAMWAKGKGGGFWIGGRGYVTLAQARKETSGISTEVWKMVARLRTLRTRGTKKQLAGAHDDDLDKIMGEYIDLALDIAEALNIPDGDEAPDRPESSVEVVEAMFGL